MRDDTTQTDEVQNKRTYSYEEYRRKFYPSSTQRQLEEAESPYEQGVRMAKQAIEKVKANFKVG